MNVDVLSAQKRLAELEFINKREAKRVVPGISFCREMVSSEDLVGIPVFLVPKPHIFGTQPDGEYEIRKQMRIKRLLKEKGTGSLLEDPIFLCAIPVGKTLMLALTDGHHETRYSPEVPNMPSYILSPEQITERIRKNQGIEVTAEDVARDFSRSVSEAMISFSKMPAEKWPRLVSNASSIDDLRNRFQQIR